MSSKHETRGALTLGAYVGGLVAANAIAAKIVQVGPSAFTAGAIAYPMTFVLQDVISERYGEQASRNATWSAFAGALVLVVYSAAAIAIPASPSSPVSASHFAEVFVPVPRVVLASLAAFLVGGLVDVRVFFAIRRRTGPGRLWVRKLGSTVVSQAMDSALFVAIAFCGAMPAPELLAMAFGQYALKATVAAASLPVTYFWLRWLK